MERSAVITKRKIGKTTYLIAASASEKATDTIDKKIEKLILKDMCQKAVEMASNGNLPQ